MADLATPSAAAMATAGTATSSTPAKEKSAPATRPERPDEEEYKTELAKAEKDLRASEERMVCIAPAVKRATRQARSHVDIEGGIHMHGKLKLIQLPESYQIQIRHGTP